jgi:hypothetical protein
VLTEQSLRNPASGQLRDLAGRAFGHPGLQPGFNELAVRALHSGGVASQCYNAGDRRPDRVAVRARSRDFLPCRH